jgi:hypothetical protein
MRVRVAAIQDEGLPLSFEGARLWLEEWLTKALEPEQFGWPKGCLAIVVFATSSMPSAPPVSRLSAGRDSEPVLALHVVISPCEIQRTPPHDHLCLLCERVAQQLPEAPLRKPKGLDYPRLRRSLLACVQPIAQSAA